MKMRAIRQQSGLERLRRGLLQGGGGLGPRRGRARNQPLPARESECGAGDRVLIQYDWIMSNGQIGDVVAVDKGFFEEQGLQVQMTPGGPNSATISPVISGQARLAQFSGVSQLLLARSAGGVPIKYFATGYQQGPFAYFSLPRAPVRTPQDLIGKRVGIQPTARSSLDALLAKTKIDPAKVNIQTIGFDMTPLVGRRGRCGDRLDHQYAGAIDHGPRPDHDDGGLFGRQRSGRRLFCDRYGFGEGRRYARQVPARRRQGLGLDRMIIRPRRSRSW